ncbi:MAG: hypothetical protein ILO34_00065, partial [Kiritimatiellae bacterium]|nr:hypothetical protein [Kiritimatiellia bacterium]
MKTKLVKLSTLVFCMLAALPSLAAANGDIYEIRPCTKGNVTIPPKATIETPIKSGGVDLYFRLRLLQRTKGAPEDNNWKLVHVGLQTEAVDWVSNPLQIGIYVSGQLRYATLVSSTPSATTGFTDLIFKYTTRVGDFALPIVLATAAGAASDMEAAGSSYLLTNLYDPETGLGEWRIANADDEDCNFWQCTPAWPVPAPETDGRNADTSLANCGFFVQTIDFDADSYKVPESNVELHSLVAASAIENEVTLKVW